MLSTLMLACESEEACWAMPIPRKIVTSALVASVAISAASLSGSKSASSAFL